MSDDCGWKTQSQNKTDMNIPFEVVTQGAPVVSDRRAHIWAKSDNIICLDVDLDSKYCEASGEGFDDGYSEVDLSATGRTLHPEAGPGGEGMTVIRFHTMQGWRVYSTRVVRYTLRVTLVKEHKGSPI